VSLPPELRRHCLLAIAMSLLVGGAGVGALFVAISPELSSGSPVPFVLFAIVIIPLAAYWLFCVPRWYRRAAHVVGSTSPMAAVATFTLDTIDSTSLYAAVSLPQSSVTPPKPVTLLCPRWNVRSVLGSALSVQLYVDPASRRLVAISTEHGMLWCIPPGQVVQASHAA